MPYSYYIYSLILTLVLGFFYNRYKHIEDVDEEQKSYRMVQQYLINTDMSTQPLLDKQQKKPILWIHMKYDVNARWWSSFYSRNSMDLNQPYLYLTIKSIIDSCGKDFNICLIDDESFTRLMPEWTLDVTLIADPIKSKIRELALANLLLKYGGFLVPPSFICFQSLEPLYRQKTSVSASTNTITNTITNTMFVAEMLNKTTTSSQMMYFPNTAFMGCLKGDQVMREYTSYLEKIVSQDYVDESTVTGAYGRWCFEKSQKGEVQVIPAEQLGIKDADGTALTIDRLIQKTYVNLAGNVLGLYLPADDIINRTAYNWFARLSAKQVLESDTTIGKYLLIARTE
jgi:hypothetical protein